MIGVHDCITGLQKKEHNRARGKRGKEMRLK